MFDVNIRETFRDLTVWLQDVRQYGHDDIKIIVVANKCDGVRRQVSMEEGQAFAREFG